MKYSFFKICIIFNQYFSVFRYIVYNKMLVFFIDYVDVAGMIVHSCYVATDVGMSQNRQQFIDFDRYVTLFRVTMPS